MIRPATKHDTGFIYKTLIENPIGVEDGADLSFRNIEDVMNQSQIFVGEHGFIMFNQITNIMWNLHPFWNGPKAKEATELAMNKIPAKKFVGFIPDMNNKAIKFFKKLGFEYEGTMLNSVLIGGELHSQLIYGKGV
jgi:RimJ/RimL family protein N-acetyltransferase